MLTILQKAAILGRAGIAVPARPAEASAEAVDPPAVPGLPSPVDAASLDQRDWGRAIETLYVSYVAARAAKSLRDAEEARQNAMLRSMASGSSPGAFA